MLYIILFLLFNACMIYFLWIGMSENELNYKEKAIYWIVVIIIITMSCIIGENSGFCDEIENTLEQTEKHDSHSFHHTLMIHSSGGHMYIY